jgi:hypothetical protein
MLRDSVAVYLALGACLKSSGYLDCSLFVLADTSYGRCLCFAYMWRRSLTLSIQLLRRRSRCTARSCRCGCSLRTCMPQSVSSMYKVRCGYLTPLCRTTRLPTIYAYGLRKIDPKCVVDSFQSTCFDSLPSSISLRTDVSYGHATGNLHASLSPDKVSDLIPQPKLQSCYATDIPRSQYPTQNCRAFRQLWRPRAPQRRVYQSTVWRRSHRRIQVPKQYFSLDRRPWH